MSDQSKVPLEGGQGFGSRDYVKNFVEKRRFPHIHNDVGKVLRERPVEEKAGLLDFGACTGMLTAQAVACGYSPVLGLELLAKDVQVFDEWVKPLLRNKAEMLQFKSNPMDPEVMAFLTDAIKSRGITTLLARRAFPEMLGATDAHNGRDMHADAPAALSRALLDGGVHTVILEGRTFSKRSVHALASVEREVEAIQSWFQPVLRYNEVVVLKAYGSPGIVAPDGNLPAEASA